MNFYILNFSKINMKQKFYNYKKYLQVFSLTFIIFLLIILLVNLNIDPGKVYPNKFKFLNNKSTNVDDVVNSLIKNKNGIILKSGIFNDRDLARSFSKNINNADCIIFGSSHIQLINLTGTNKSFKNICKSILNFGINGGVIEDYIALSKNIDLKKNSENKKIFLTIHPWTLNLNSDNRWQRNLDDYEFTLKKITNSRGEKTKKNLYNNLLIKNLFNFDYFVESIKSFKNRNSSLDFVYDLEKKYESQILLYDGSIIKPDKKFIDAEKHIKKGLANYKIQKNNLIDKNAIFLLTKYIEYFENNFEIIFLLSPYHPEVWKNKHSDVIDAMLLVEDKVHSIAKRNKINVLGSFKPQKVGCDENEFFDLLHPKKSCLSKIEKLKFYYK